MQIDEKQLKADLDVFMPIIESAVKLAPGSVGENIANLLTALDSDAILVPVVALINKLLPKS